MEQSEQQTHLGNILVAGGGRLAEADPRLINRFVLISVPGSGEGAGPVGRR